MFPIDLVEVYQVFDLKIYVSHGIFICTESVFEFLRKYLVLQLFFQNNFSFFLFVKLVYSCFPKFSTLDFFFPKVSGGD